MSTLERARELQRLHGSPEILQVVNVWDAVSAKAIAAVPGTTAIATAGHSIAASLGYRDGEMPSDVALAAVKPVVDAVDLPVSADLDNGYDDPAETVRRAIGIGVVGANIEDRLLPFDESVRRVDASMRAAEKEGVPFQLNARTDAIVRGGDAPMEARVDDAIRRGLAFLGAGAPLVFVPGVVERAHVERIVDAFGRGRLSITGAFLGALTAPEYEALGVARISYGPITQRVALAALQNLAADLYDGGLIPSGVPILN
ncbi:isocitrate lyase/PEP mutase family protein [Leifsonia poae]|uniref:isocitrate lyase/PEP mutase family protein n=1 Tax=Leifsonia poae TaxID=110933 RepID=UPI003D67F641